MEELSFMMKPSKIVPQAIALRFSTPLRTVNFKNRRRQFYLKFYGTSSKPATSNFSSPRVNFLNFIKNASDNILPVLWKSVNIASSILNNAAFKFSKSNIEENKVDEKPLTSDRSSNSLTAENITESSKKDVSEPKIKAVASTPVKTVQNKENLEQAFADLLTINSQQTKKDEILQKEVKATEKTKQVVISKASLEQRSRFLVQSLSDASSPGSKLLRLEEVCKHLLLYPQQKTVMCRTGLVRTALRLRYHSADCAIQAKAKTVLALIGFHDPPNGQGIRILSIDGGGTRGIMAMEVLRQLETRTNRKIYELFDYMCGVSSGAILCFLLGGLRFSIDECEALYRKLSNEVFSQSTFWGTGRLMWNHAYYDTTTWINVLKKTFGEKLLIDTSMDKDSPKLGAISAVMNLPNLQAFVFRNYDFSPRVQSHYLGSCKNRMWEAVRASGAAPGYFEEHALDDYLHQDGGLMVNNPTAVAIHEARTLWPAEPIQCVVSLGTGRYIPVVYQSDVSYTSLKTKVLKVIDSATDTEGVHIGLNDLLSPNTYFRLNPYLTEFLNLDENRPEKLDQMKRDVQMYLRRNEYKFSKAAYVLCLPRSYKKRFYDWVTVQKAIYL